MMDRKNLSSPVLLVIALWCAGLVFCQELDEPTVTLTQEQWKRVQKNILVNEPTPQVRVGAVFDGKIELIGYDLEPEVLIPGKELTLIWYWRCVKPIEENYKVFIHLDSLDGGGRQGLDHHPVENLYQTSLWEEGQIIKDKQKVTLKASYKPGKAELLMGFFNETNGERMKVSNHVPMTEDKRVRAGAVNVEKELVKYRVKKVVKPLVIDGNLNDSFWRKASRTPVFVDPNGAGKVKHSTWAQMGYDDNHLYIAYRVNDTNIVSPYKNRDEDTWKHDVVEFFIDANGDKKDYVEIEVTPANVVFDAYFHDFRKPDVPEAKQFNLAGLRTSVKVVGSVNGDQGKDQYYTVEMAIPLISLPDWKPGTDPLTADVRVNMFRTEYVGEGQISYSAWAPAHGSFHKTEQFGQLTFEKGPKTVPAKSPKTGEPSTLHKGTTIPVPNKVQPLILKESKAIPREAVEPKIPEEPKTLKNTEIPSEEPQTGESKTSSPMPPKKSEHVPAPVLLP